MSLAFVFPGQGSQSVGMLGKLQDLPSAHAQIITQTFDEANTQLGLDLWKIVRNGPDDELNQTQYTQPAILSVSIALWRIWQLEQGKMPAMMAGHSLGEYSALVCAGSLSFTHAVKLVHARGRYMQQAVAEGEGAMAAILGLEDAAVIAVCTQVQQDLNRLVAAVNFNAPGQVVIAGYRDAVEQVMQQAKAEGAKRALLLPVSVPSHCALMQNAADKLAQDFAQVSFQTPQIPVVHNVNVASETHGDKIPVLLLQQLTHPVRWVETIQFMQSQGVRQIVECGPGKVLTGLNKRIARQLPGYAMFDVDSLQQIKAKMVTTHAL